MKKSDLIIRNRVETAIREYMDPVLWAKNVLNLELRTTQKVHIQEIMAHNHVLDVLPPRFGKTVEMEFVNLYETATTPWEDGRIWGPKEDQAKESLKYQTEWIENSPILRRYVARKNGKRQISTTGYTFMNASNWKAFGIYSNFEGENATIIRGEEFDDMDMEVWNTRVLQRGGAANRNNKPTRIRLTGTIQAGKGNIFQADADPTYFTMTKWDVFVGLELGYYDNATIQKIHDTLTEDEWKRIYLLQYTEAKNFIHEQWVRNCIQAGLKLEWAGISPDDNESYTPHGVVYAGLDMGDSGEKKSSSYYSAQFIEAIGDKRLWLGGRRWKPTEDPQKVKKEFVDLWRFYHASYGMGDALKADMVRDINKMLYAERLINTNPDNFEAHSQADWKKWDFPPVWNTAEFKWQNGYALAKMLEETNLVLPYFNKHDTSPHARVGKSLIQNLKNIKAERKGTAKYPKISFIKALIGDDDFDGLVMACASSFMHSHPVVDLSRLKTTGQNRVVSHDFKPDIDFRPNISRGF
jgi:hypothetical protein